MNRATTPIKSAVLCLSLLSCADGRTVGERIADMPHWMGGPPADAPPRRGTPEYDEMMAKRAQEAARPKTEQQSNISSRSPLIVRMHPLIAGTAPSVVAPVGSGCWVVGPIVRAVV
jgi:hypothetical protein